MIQVIESTGPVPPEIEQCGPGAPAYMIFDPGEGHIEARIQIEAQLRHAYRGEGIIFVGNHRLDDGRVVSVGQKINPLLALRMTAR